MEKPRVVLIVDDDDDDRILFREAMVEIDQLINCISANDGEEAIRLLDRTSTLPDFIFLDLNMPRLNGKQCLTEIRKRPRLGHIPVIIYSTTCRAEDEEETKSLGAVYFLTKPVLFSEICNALTNILRTNWTGRK